MSEWKISDSALLEGDIVHKGAAKNTGITMFCVPTKGQSMCGVNISWGRGVMKRHAAK